MIGRRIQHVHGKLPWAGEFPAGWQPGDYCGPVLGYTGDIPAVMFVLPVLDAEGQMVFAHVCSPPHTFRECGDGSLEIRNSILTTRNGEPGFSWHGYLDEGHVWRTV